MMGMFAASELFKLVNTKYLVADSSARKVSVKVIFASFKRAVRYPWVILRGSFIGVFVGAVPGIGSSVANLLSYITTKRKHKEPESFGKGKSLQSHPRRRTVPRRRVRWRRRRWEFPVVVQPR